MSVILIICNDDPSYVDIFGNVKWSELAVVQDISTLNILLISTIFLGWISLVLDIIYTAAAVVNKDNKDDQSNTTGFWKAAFLLEGLGYLNKKPSDTNHSQQKSEYDSICKDGDAVTDEG